MESKLKPPKVVKCPVDAFDLTKDKEYKVIETMAGLGIFAIKDDVGAKITCKETSCLHIKGDWIIVEREQ